MFLNEILWMNRALLSSVLINCARVVCHNSPTHVLNALTHDYLAFTHFAKKKKNWCQFCFNTMLFEEFILYISYFYTLSLVIICFVLTFVFYTPNLLKKTKQKTKIGNYFKGWIELIDLLCFLYFSFIYVIF